MKCQWLRLWVALQILYLVIVNSTGGLDPSSGVGAILHQHHTYNCSPLVSSYLNLPDRHCHSLSSSDPFSSPQYTHTPSDRAIFGASRLQSPSQNDVLVTPTVDGSKFLDMFGGASSRLGGNSQKRTSENDGELMQVQKYFAGKGRLGCVRRCPANQRLSDFELVLDFRRSYSSTQATLRHLSVTLNPVQLGTFSG